MARERPAQERALAPPMLGAQIWQRPISSLNPRDIGGGHGDGRAVVRRGGKRALTVWLAVADADDRPDYSVQGGYLFMPREGDTWTAQVAITWPRAPWARRGIGARVAGARQGVEAARARHAALEKKMRLAVRCMSSGAGTRRFGRIDSR